MSAAFPTKRRPKTRMAIALAVAGGLILLIAANTHLVYTAVTSQPDCVAHLRQGDAGAQSGSFRAAMSACSPGARS